MSDFKQTEDLSVIGVDSRGYVVNHYALAERLMQVEYRRIAQEIVEQPSSTRLISILEQGCRGYHDRTGGELWSEWNAGAETLWYEMADAGVLPWSVWEDDPVAKSQTVITAR